MNVFGNVSGDLTNWMVPACLVTVDHVLAYDFMWRGFKTISDPVAWLVSDLPEGFLRQE
jgi:hypothetical protein